MLYTRKGDSGTTKTFGCDQRISKSSIIAEALGTLDEVNSFLGIVKTMDSSGLEVGVLKDGKDAIIKLPVLIHDVQENLFIVQAELAGAPKTIEEEKVKSLEYIVDHIEKTLPPIKTFFISGGTSLSAHLDFSRTLVRRAERRVVAVGEEGKVKVGVHTLAYLNRLSSLFYALARLNNHFSGINEESPKYK
jgi:cob(I)alamin adenosyltransferase